MNTHTCPCCNNSGAFEIKSYDTNPSEHKWAYNCFSGKTLASCPQCNTLFLCDDIEEEQLSRFYEELYKTDGHTLNFSSKRLYELMPRSLSQVNFMASSINLFDNIKILEIGSNQYGMAPAFSLYCKPEYYYFDQFEFPIINHYGGKRLGNYFTLEAAKALNSDQKMDLITLSHSLEHFNPSSLNESIEAMATALKPNGSLFIEVPYQLDTPQCPPHTLFYSLEGLVSLLCNNGFEITTTQKIIAEKTNGTKPAKPSGFYKLLITLLKINLKLFRRFNLIRTPTLKLLLSEYTRQLGINYDRNDYLRVIARKP